MIYFGINPDLSDWVITCGKVLFAILVLRYRQALWDQLRGLTPGDQYRLHIQNGGYRP